MGKTDQCTRILMATRHKFSTLAFRVHIWNQSVYFFWRKPLIPQPRVASTGHELTTHHNLQAKYSSPRLSNM